MTVLRRFTWKSFAGIYAERIRAAMALGQRVTRRRAERGPHTEHLQIDSTVRKENQDRHHAGEYKVTK